MSTVTIHGLMLEISYQGKTYPRPNGWAYLSYPKIKEITGYEILDSRDGGWDGNRIFTVKTPEGQTIEVSGYWSNHGTITINLP